MFQLLGLNSHEIVLLGGSSWAEEVFLDFSFVTCMLLVGVKRSSTVVRMATKPRPVGISEFGSTGLNDTFKITFWRVTEKIGYCEETLTDWRAQC